MTSPFPGMNPYLEQEDAWEDFHGSFMPVARELLEAQVGADYFVKIEEHIYIHELSAEQRRFLGRADVSVSRPPDPSSQPGTAVLPGAIPVRLPAIDVERQSFLQIRDRRNRRVVTVIELLSPSNKRPGADREQFEAKRAAVLASSAHYVEIDLLRGWPRMPVEDPPACDYWVLVSRYEERPGASLWPVGLRERLPEISVPLQVPDANIRLDLQQIVHRVYDAANYGKYIYTSDPVPPLSAEDAAWAQQFVPRREVPPEGQG